MSWKNRRRITGSLFFRLAFLYAGLCIVSFSAVLMISYFMLRSTHERHVDYELLGEIKEYGALLGDQNLPVLEDALNQEAISNGVNKVFFRILDKSGREVFATANGAWDGLGVNHALLQPVSSGQTVFDVYRDSSRRYPARIVYGPLGSDWILQIGVSSEDMETLLLHFQRLFSVVALLFTICSILAGGIMARGSLYGVQRVTQAARDIASGAWSSRVPVSPRGDEIDELASAFNHMIGRIQYLVKELREVTDDIAHDLRTPVARIRASAEWALEQADGHPVRQETAGSILEECDHLLHLINTMLEISQTEAGARPPARVHVLLSEAVEDVADLFRTAAGDKRVHIRVETCPGLTVQGDPLSIRRALAHVVDNAVKYTPPEGTIEVACSRKDRHAVISVTDTGIGISQEDLGRIFDRFFRVEPSRSLGGNGLGLSLARAIVRAHEGDITVVSTPGQGSVFHISFPCEVGTAPIPERGSPSADNAQRA